MLTRLCVKKPYTVLVIILVVVLLGGVSLSSLQTDLLPNMNLPYLAVITTYPGASPERVESDVTEPLESALGTVTGVKNVTSTSSENYGMVMLEFEEETDMDSAMVKISSAINEVTLPETCGKPSILEISMDMIASMYISVSYDGKDIYELSDFTESTVIPYLERQKGVANITNIGLVDKTVEVRLSEEKVQELNDQMIEKVDEKFADARKELKKAEKELKKAQKELDEGKSELEKQEAALESSKSQLNNQAAETYAQLATASEATAQLVAYQTQLQNQQANLAALKAAKSAAEKAMKEQGISPKKLDSLLTQAQDGLTQVNDGIAAIDTSITGLDELINTYSAKEALDPTDYMVLGQILGQEAAMNITSPSQVVSLLKGQKKDLKTTRKQLTTQKTTLEQSIEGLKTAKSSLADLDSQIQAQEIEIQVTKTIVEQYESRLEELGVSYADIEAGKLQAAAGFGSAEAQLAAGQTALAQAMTQIDQGQAQIDEAKEQLKESKKQLKKARKEALEKANLDQLMNMDMLAQIVQAQNFSMPAGYIEGEWLLRVGDEYESEEEIANILLCDVDGIGEVRLADVAEIVVIDNSDLSYARANGQQAVVLSVFKSSTEGTSVVSDACNKAFKELEEKYPGLKISVFMDQGDYIDLIVNSLFSNLIWGALLAVLVLAIFLKDLKPTLVVAISIPFSVLCAVVAMYFSGISINMISLSGLTLGIGMLVDNSVVVVENIYRLRSRGISVGRAAVQGAKQVAGAIVASTLTTVAVFFPIVFAGGLTKTLLVDMALTITYSLLASLAVALTVVPALSSTVMKKSTPKSHKLFDKMMTVYGKTLAFCLRFKVVPLVISIGLLVFSIYRVGQMGIVMMPETGSNQLNIRLQVPEDMTREEAYQMADQVLAEADLNENIAEIGAMSASASRSMMSSLASSGDYSSFSYFITLKDGADAKVVGEELTEALKDIKGELTVNTSGSNSMSGFLASGLQIDIYGDDLDDLLKASQDVMDIVGQVEGFTEISNGQEEGKETIHLIIDQDQAMKWNLTTAQIFMELSGKLTDNKKATTITMEGNNVDVKVIDQRDPITVDNLLEYPFEVTITEMDGTSTTETHLLKEFASTETLPGVASISRENQARHIAVTASIEEGFNTSMQSREVQELLDAYEAPEGITIEMGGETTAVNEMIWQMVKMILMALALIYLIMVAQFQSLLSPFIVIFTIPLAFTGGMIGLLISGENLSMMSLMGFLVLAGVVVNNGIVFVDYTNQLRYGGLTKHQALIAAGKTRMRPILMTTLTTVFSMVVMLLSRDQGSAMGRGLAIVVVGGLLYATFMTLYLVPVMYDLLFRRKEMKEIDTGDNDMDELPDDAKEFLAAQQQG